MKIQLIAFQLSCCWSGLRRHGSYLFIPSLKPRRQWQDVSAMLCFSFAMYIKMLIVSFSICPSSATIISIPNPGLYPSLLESKSPYSQAIPTHPLKHHVHNAWLLHHHPPLCCYPHLGTLTPHGRRRSWQIRQPLALRHPRSRPNPSIHPQRTQCPKETPKSQTTRPGILHHRNILPLRRNRRYRRLLHPRTAQHPRNSPIQRPQRRLRSHRYQIQPPVPNFHNQHHLGYQRRRIGYEIRTPPGDLQGAKPLLPIPPFQLGVIQRPFQFPARILRTPHLRHPHNMLFIALPTQPRQRLHHTHRNPHGIHHRRLQHPAQQYARWRDANVRSGQDGRA